MKLIPITSLIIPEDRQRQEFDPEAMEELKNSIEDLGLMHPIVTRPGEQGPTLVAGERRFRAISDIYALGGTFKCDGEEVPPGMLPTVSLGELDALAAEEAELDENLKRRDLTWQEHAAALQKLHNLRVKQAATAVPDTAPSESEPTPVKVHTVADTAKEIHGRSDGAYQDSIRKELIVARHLDNPEVAKAKTVDEAFKVLKKQETMRQNEVLAAAVGSSFSSESHTLLKGDCLTVMEQLIAEGKKFDVICTDPPYGMGADQFGDGGGKLANIDHSYDDSYGAWIHLMARWTTLSAQIAKPMAHAYVFCDIDRFHELKRLMETAGWDVFRTPLIVYKTDSGRVPRPDYGPRRQWEMVLYALKGNRPVNQILSDVIPSKADPQMQHGAQKPVAVYTDLLMRSVRPGDEVLDCFAGSGTVFPAAHGLKVKATGIEQNPAYQGMCLKRLEAIKMTETMGLF